MGEEKQFPSAHTVNKSVRTSVTSWPPVLCSLPSPSHGEETLSSKEQELKSLLGITLKRNKEEGEKTLDSQDFEAARNMNFKTGTKKRPRPRRESCRR